MCVCVRERESLSCVRLFVTPWTVAHQDCVHWDSPGKNTEVVHHVLLQGIFPTHGLNPGLLHFQVDYLLSEPPGKPFIFLVTLKVSVAQSCPTVCDPMDCSLPGSSVHGIFQARILEWVAISFSGGSSQ